MPQNGSTARSGLKKATFPGDGRLLRAPGVSVSRATYDMLYFGQQMRDQNIWQYPIIGGALQTFQTLASNREFKVIGTPRGAPKALEYINNARSRLYDGTVDYGFEQFLKRLALDDRCIGKTMWHWDKEYITYLDPPEMRFDIMDQKYTEIRTGDEYPVKEIVVNYAVPIGGAGYFISPLMSLMPMATFMWLVSQHNQASVDGRKVREIFVTIDSELAEQMKQGFEDIVSMWSGATDPTSNQIMITYIEDTNITDATKLVARVGLSQLPENYDPAAAEATYVNEIGNTTGMSIKEFYQNEDANGGNRSLEEVQMIRQGAKGPAAFVRSHERRMNACGCLKQFGKNTRIAFYEDVDAVSREVNAKVIELYSRALLQFATVFGGTVNGDGLLQWLISENILPADIDLITVGTAETTVGSDPATVPGKGNTIATTVPNQPVVSKSTDLSPLKYDEIALDRNGRVVERRVKMFKIEKWIKGEMEKEHKKSMTDNFLLDDSFKASLVEGQKNNYQKIKAIPGTPPEFIKSLDEDFDKVTIEQHQKIFEYLREKGLISYETA